MNVQSQILAPYLNGQMLRETRLANNLTQANLALAIGVRRQTINAWERRNDMNTRDKLAIIALFPEILPSLQREANKSPRNQPHPHPALPFGSPVCSEKSADVDGPGLE